MAPQNPRFAPLALSMALALAATTTHAQDAGVLAGAPVPIHIQAQPLAQALNDWARQTRIQVIVQQGLVAGKTAPEVSGRLTAQQALDRLLAGSGLRATAEGQAVVIQPAVPAGAESSLPAVTVTAEPPSAWDGSAASGYRTGTVSSVGALGSMDLKDVPFSMSVVPQELIQNIQAQSPDDLYKLNPSTRTVVAQGTGWTPMVSIRGFSTYDTAEDGLRRPYNHAAVIEDKERIEVLNGLSGFLYGAAAPAGMVNYVYKRPTTERLRSVTVGNYGGGQAYVHGDFGGRIDEAGRAGYRLNVVRQNGNTAIDDQKIDRALVSGALDWKPTDQLLLELNAVYNHYKTRSPSAYWYYDGVAHGKAPDASKNWSQPWIRDEFENTKLMGKLSYRFNDHVTLRTAYTHSTVDRPVQDHTLNSVDTDGEYTQIAIHSGRTRNRFDAAQALADVRFDTGPLEHMVSTGYFMTAYKDWGTTYSPNTGWTGPYALSSPARLSEPTYASDTSSPYVSGKGANSNYVLGDHITFNAQWSALLGITHSLITTEDFMATGAKAQADYRKSRNSPSASLLFKPLPWLTTYASYIEGLEMGGRAPSTAANSDSVMAPMVSRQKELGAKADARGMLLTAAVFDIEKAYEYLDASNVYTQNGRQRHRGVEFTATGKLTRRLTLLGGVTWLDASVRGGDYDGKAPMNVARVLSKAYAEYELPVTGLTLTGGVFHTGRQWADKGNVYRLAAYTTVDLGLRYATQAYGRPLTLRLYASNVADKSYWANSYYTGAPRSVAFSAQYQF